MKAISKSNVRTVIALANWKQISRTRLNLRELYLFLWHVIKHGLDWINKTWINKTWSDKTWINRTWSDKTWINKTWGHKTWSDKTWLKISDGQQTTPALWKLYGL